MISIIDYGAGNLHSVKKAFDFLGFETAIVHDPAEVKKATHIVLPGVGAFGDAMDNLRNHHMMDAVSEAIAKNVNFLGICLGMQMLFESSDEGGKATRGLDIFPEKIIKIPDLTQKGERIIVPHMGWNHIYSPAPENLKADPILFEKTADDSSQPYFYFVHSFHCPLSKSIEPYVIAACDYGVPFAAAVRRGNCIGVQFHPEKSGSRGLKLLERFGGLPVC